MGKLMSLLGVCTLTLLFSPLYVFAEGTGAESAEPSGLLLTFLTVMSLGTIVVMIYMCARDNG